MHRTQAVRERSWTQQRWNNHLSLSLITNITPRLRGPLHHGAGRLTTAAFCAAMGRERRASLADLLRVSSERGLQLWRRSFALFYNSSRFMVSHLNLPRLSTPQLRGCVMNLEEAGSALHAIESMVSERPAQWFNFHPVWPQDRTPSRAAKS